MSNNLRRILISSTSVLILLGINAVGLRTNAVRAARARVVTAAHQRRSGYRAGYTSGQYLYRHSMNFSHDNLRPYLVVSLMNDHAPANRRSYERNYVNGYNSYANRPDSDNKRHTNNQDTPGYLLSDQKYDRANRIYKALLKRPYAYFKGYADQFANVISANGDDKIPVQYRWNVDYAEGYLHLLHKASRIKDLDSLNDGTLCSYGDYYDAGGRVPYIRLLGHHYRYLYQNYCRAVKHGVYNALTDSQNSRYYRHDMKAHRFSKNDRAAFNVFKEGTYEGMGYNDGAGDGTGGYIWKGTGFARNVIRKAPFYRNVYFTKGALNYSGITTPGTAYDGVIVGLRGNNTRAARQTALNLVKYVHNQYRDHPNKALDRKFSKRYKINTVAEANSVSGSRISYTQGVSIYRVLNRHAKRSMVAYYVPDGKGPLGYVPIPND